MVLALETFGVISFWALFTVAVADVHQLWHRAAASVPYAYNASVYLSTASSSLATTLSVSSRPTSLPGPNSAVPASIGAEVSAKGSTQPSRGLYSGAGTGTGQSRTVQSAIHNSTNTIFAIPASASPTQSTSLFAPYTASRVVGNSSAAIGPSLITAPTSSLPPYPRSTGNASISSSSRTAFCGGCTVSAIDATVIWWYPQSLQYGYRTAEIDLVKSTTTIESASQTFDLTGALAQTTWSLTTSFDMLHNVTVTVFQSFAASQLVTAGATSVISMPAYKTLPTGVDLPSGAIESARITPVPIASVVVPGVANKTVFSVAFGTPYLYIPAYMLYRATNTTDDKCLYQGTSYNLSEAYYGSYDGPDPVEQLSVTAASLPASFLAGLPPSHAQCEQVLIAEVEVLIVVTLTYVYAATSAVSTPNVGGAPHTESTVTVMPTTSVEADKSMVITANPAAMTVGCQGSTCRPIIAIAQREHTATGDDDTSVPITTRVIEPIATSTEPGGKLVTLFAVHHEITVPVGDPESGSQPTAGGGGIDSSQPEDASGGGDPNKGGRPGPSLKPLVVHLEHTVVTFFAPVTEPISEATVTFQGETLIATAEPTTEDRRPGAGSGSAPTAQAENAGGSSEAGSASNPGGSTGDTGFAPPRGSTGAGGSGGNDGESIGEHIVAGLEPGSSPGDSNGVPVLTVGSRTIVGNAATQFFFGEGQTLTPGGAIRDHGTSVSLAPAGNFVVVDGKTQNLTPVQATSPPVLIVGGTSFTADADSTFRIDGQELVPGSTIVVHGTTIGLGPQADRLVVNGATLTRPPTIMPSFPVLRIGDETLGPVSDRDHPGSSGYIIGTQTLLPGGSALTLFGTTVSLLPSGAGVIINGITSSFSLSTLSGLITAPPVLTISGHTYTAVPGGGTTYVIDGQTLTPGGAITADGNVISLAPKATALAVDGSTTALFPATSAHALGSMATETRHRLSTGAFAETGSGGGGGDVPGTAACRGKAYDAALLAFGAACAVAGLGFA